MQPDRDPPAPDETPDVVRRPPGHLLDYPVKLRWELTRRHPYYVALWEEARRYYQNPPGDSSGRRARGHAARLVLGAIGVHGVPVAPGTPFADLFGPGADPGFLCGSLQPVTFRGLAVLLLGQLEPVARGYVAAALTASVANERDRDQSSADCRFNAERLLGDLGAMACPELDRVPGGPVFLMHLGASQNAIVADAADQARRWKDKMKSPTSKIHTAKVARYLEVWDRFEGWTGSGYDLTREQKLQEIARQTKQPVSSVYSHYRAAFEAVTGNAFRPELWWRAFGPLKLTLGRQDVVRRYASTNYRRMVSLQFRPVPETTLEPRRAEGREGFVTRNKTADDDSDTNDLVLDVRSCIANGLPDEQILQELGLNNVELIAYIRNHGVKVNDLLGLSESSIGSNRRKNNRH